MTIKASAWAKINLTLHITGQRADGYHLLDSLVVFADVADRLWLTPGDALGLSVTGPFADGVPVDARNLVWQAAERAGWRGDIRLEKNLPHGAGIGGGSADAAAVLRELNAPDHAAQLGADVPVCLSPHPQQMTGIGEICAALPNIPALPLVLVNPGVHVPTPDVFRALSQKENPPMGSLPMATDCEGFTDWLAAQRNDLQLPALGLAPVIKDVLTMLEGARLTRMSGSGATCFGIYDSLDTARAAADRIVQARPDWWVRAVQTFGASADIRLTGN